jgi:hypothetical protein
VRYKKPHMQSDHTLADPPRAAFLGLFLLSAATLIFEIELTRLFSVSQFYHFAFMIVSVALLGFGASGTFLAIFPHFGASNPRRSIGWLSFACGGSILGSYLLVNWLPFDSFSIAWDQRQIAILSLHYLALATPFFFSGLAVGSLLVTYSSTAARTYAVNLCGSALGCLVALAAPPFLGGEGSIVLSAGLAGWGSLACLFSNRERLWKIALPLGLVLFGLLDTSLRLSSLPSFGWLELNISPYKDLSYALQYPGAGVIHREWNSFSRLDVVRSPGIRSLPGLSYLYLQSPPREDGLFVDAGELSPLLSPGYQADFFAYLPLSIAFQMRPGGDALILEPRGGLDALTALENGAGQITLVESNPLIVAAADHIYADPRMNVIVDSDRSYLRRSRESFDVIVLCLANSFHPVRSGAYSLAEDYRYTVEAFQDALNRLQPDGLLAVMRWLQTPPSESLRVFGLAVAALERSGRQPGQQVLAFRGYNTITLLVKNGLFSDLEIQRIRDFTETRAFDLVYAPGMLPEEANRHNILPEPVYYQNFQALLNTTPRADFYAAYPFEVSPPTDDQPFFYHFFKWSQTPQILAEFGKAWQPFGGAGYFVILALLALASILAGIIIVLPAPIAHWRRVRSARDSRESESAWNLRQAIPFLAYFSLIGLAFLLVEIPLIQRFILFLGHPAYAFSGVLFTILLFSGLGSQLSPRISLRVALGALVLSLVALPFLLPSLLTAFLGLAFPLRLVATAVILAPLGILMGMPFPGGISWMANGAGSPNLVPWVWAVNGAASVIASILAALLALSFGFNWVFRIGALCYAGAWLMLQWISRTSPSNH